MVATFIFLRFPLDPLALFLRIGAILSLSWKQAVSDTYLQRTKNSRRVWMAGERIHIQYQTLPKHLTLNYEITAKQYSTLRLTCVSSILSTLNMRFGLCICKTRYLSPRRKPERARIAACASSCAYICPYMNVCLWVLMRVLLLWV